MIPPLLSTKQIIENEFWEIINKMRNSKIVYYPETNTLLKLLLSNLESDEKLKRILYLNIKKDGQDIEKMYLFEVLRKIEFRM